MNLEDELFRYFRVDKDLLEPFGFVKKDEGYFYREKIMDGRFSVLIEINGKGKLKGKVIDEDLDEEYDLFRSVNRSGFANEVREEYIEVLKRIAVGCFKAAPFASNQGNMISDYVYQQYGDIPDNPFKKTSDYMVIRNHNNNKWYALFTSLPKNKLTGDSEEMVEVMNVKVSSETGGEMLKMKDVFPAYHMNKKNWITVIMDAAVNDELVKSLIDESYSLTEYHSKSDLSPSDWLVPANPAYFDVVGAFEREGTLAWPMRKKMQPGDNVYIYYSAPYSSIVMKAQVISVDADRLTEMELVETYEKDRYPLSKLKEAGLKTVRFVNRIPQSVKQYIEEN